jgi:hypothetical protein
MNRTSPAETKLVICVWHPFTYWRPESVMPQTIHARWPEMRVVHLPGYDRLPAELPDTDIFVGYSLRAEQLTHAKKLKWIHSTAAGVAQLMYPELRDSGIVVTNPSGVFSPPSRAISPTPRVTKIALSGASKPSGTSRSASPNSAAKSCSLLGSVRSAAN